MVCVWFAVDISYVCQKLYQMRYDRLHSVLYQSANFRIVYNHHVRIKNFKSIKRKILSFQMPVYTTEKFASHSKVNSVAKLKIVWLTIKKNQCSQFSHSRGKKTHWTRQAWSSTVTFRLRRGDRHSNCNHVTAT